MTGDGLKRVVFMGEDGFGWNASQPASEGASERASARGSANFRVLDWEGQEEKEPETECERFF